MRNNAAAILLPAEWAERTHWADRAEASCASRLTFPSGPGREHGSPFPKTLSCCCRFVHSRLSAALSISISRKHVIRRFNKNGWGRAVLLENRECRLAFRRP
ncbi:hypothetical protein [Bacteroides fluxus]|uniref:hypothetical protein n=1 Tax=Bacteroides fluxus TaxID=626930 RepID=UPI0023F120CC|nr:hypothetical protein [Bacteroides fluxus]